MSSEHDEAGVDATNALLGTDWNAVDIAGEAPLGREAPSISFGEEGRMSGFTGVNRYNASYEVAGNQVTFGVGAMTRMAGPPAAMAQEQRFVDVLSGSCSFEIDGDRLVIRADAGEITFERITPDAGRNDGDEGVGEEE